MGILTRTGFLPHIGCGAADVPRLLARGARLRAEAMAAAAQTRAARDQSKAMLEQSARLIQGFRYRRPWPL